MNKIRLQKILLCLSFVVLLGSIYGLYTLVKDDIAATTQAEDLETLDVDSLELKEFEMVPMLELMNLDDIVETVEETKEPTEPEPTPSPTPTVDIYELKREEAENKLNSINSTDKKEWFLAYKEIIEEYAEWIDLPETIYDVFTSDEIYLMQRCIETETFEGSFASKVNVANVIFNRLNSDEFPNTIHKIIVPVQFAFGRKDISEDTKLALEYAYMFEDTTYGALFFHSNPKTATFNGANYIFTDDIGHHFYK